MLDFRPQGMLLGTGIVSLFHLLSQTIYTHVEGTVVEFGCNQGFSAAFMQETLDEADPKHCAGKRIACRAD